MSLGNFFMLDVGELDSSHHKHDHLCQMLNLHDGLNLNYLSASLCQSQVAARRFGF
jgi:hypothetical protein